MGNPTIGSSPSCDLTRLKKSRGTYVLLLELVSPARIMVGKLGAFAFPAGWYAYAGSACGPGGLAARLGHHLRVTPRPHWHIDYLRARSRIAEIWYGRTQRRDEHQWAACLQALAGTPPVAQGFGSSDCRCTTHLVAFPARPQVTPFRKRLKAYEAGAKAPVHRIRLDSPRR